MPQRAGRLERAGARIGCGTAFPTDPRVVFDELRRASAGGPADYSAVTWERLDAGESLHWPCTTERPQGTPRLFLDRFATPDGRARFVAVDHVGPAEADDADYPLVATTGGCSSTTSPAPRPGSSTSWSTAAGDMFVQVHPDTAEAAGLADGDLATS